MLLLDGKILAKEISIQIKKTIETTGINPTVYSVLVGDDPGAIAYSGVKGRKAKKLGINFEVLSLPESIKEDELCLRIKELSDSADVDAVIIERPLPKHIDFLEVIKNLSPLKDVDCASAENLGKILLEDSLFYPATAAAVCRILDYYNISVEGKHVVIAGRSVSVGKPLINMLVDKRRNATVTICHSRTKNMPQITRNADILVTAIGRAKFFGSEYIAKGTVVIDVGTNYTDDGLFGDVDMEAVTDHGSLDIVSAISPVPGGVGPVTTAILFENVVKAVLYKNT